MSIIEKAIDKLKTTHAGERTEIDIGAESESKTRSPQNNRLARSFHIDAELLSTSGIVSSNGVMPYVADEYRRIKRPLLANAFGNEAQLVKDGNLILVTSSLPSEGKSFTAINLALSIAMERDRTVLLVDADVTKSKITKITDLESHKGLVDALLDRSLDLSEVIITTDFPGLSVLPSGRMHSHTTELLASERMGELLIELATRYSNRIILFDAPPILVTPETQILCDRMGQIVFVVEMGVTSKDVVAQATSLIPKDKAIGLVLNKARKMSGQSDYGDYGGYGGY